MDVLQPVQDPGLAKHVALENVITCSYLSLILVYLYFTNSLYNIAGAESNILIYVICKMEAVKYFLCSVNLNKFQQNKYILRNALKGFGYFIIMTAVYHISAVLFGAPFISNWKETLFFALVLSSLTIPSLCFNLGTDAAADLILSISSYSKNETTSRHMLNLRATIFGAWLGAVVIPLDWDRPWQVWPIPCCLGAILSCLVANFYSLCVHLKIMTRKKTKTHRLNL